MEVEMSETDLRSELIRHRREIAGFIFALTRDHETAEEVFQEVALAILDEAARDARVERFLPWAREIARRRTLRYYSERGAASGNAPLAPEMVEAISLAYEEAEEPTADEGARLNALKQCLERLPARAREAVEKRYRDGMAVRDVARAMAVKVESLSVSLSRVRKTLADCVKRKLRQAGAV
jgi:RNA polymerase sigma-70 factor (ECF subfamily)